jgi:hypothetical protein
MVLRKKVRMHTNSNKFAYTSAHMLTDKTQLKKAIVYKKESKLNFHFDHCVSYNKSF